MSLLFTLNKNKLLNLTFIKGSMELGKFFTCSRREEASIPTHWTSNKLNL